MDMMAAVGSHAGELTQDDLREINDFAASEHFNEIEKAILQYATEVTLTPVQVSDENFELLRQNFDEKQLVELTTAIAWENYRARYDHAFGVESGGFSK